MKKFLIALSLFIPIISIADNIKEKINNTSVPSRNIPSGELKSLQRNQLESFLNKNQYPEFFEKFNIAYPSYSKDSLEFLELRKHDAHVPIYWLLADHYAKNNNAKETHRWLYVAIAMTEQDATLCTDKSAMHAPKKILRHFSSIYDTINKSGTEINQGLAFASFFTFWILRSLSKAPLLAKNHALLEEGLHFHA